MNSATPAPLTRESLLTRGTELLQTLPTEVLISAVEILRHLQSASDHRTVQAAIHTIVRSGQGKVTIFIQSGKVQRVLREAEEQP